MGVMDLRLAPASERDGTRRALEVSQCFWLIAFRV